MRALLFPLAVLFTVVLASSPAFAQSKPSLGVTPTRLSFIGSDKADRLPSQQVQVRNLGDGELAWRARATASWVILKPDRGLAPATLVVGIDLSALPPGRHAARVVVESAGAAGSPQTIDIDVAIASTRPPEVPALKVTPDRVGFSAPAGQTDKLTFTLHVSAEQNAAIRWTARSDKPWLEVSPREGTAPTDIVLSASPAALPTGEHTAMVLFSTGANSTPLRVPVTFRVQSAGGRLSFASTSLPAAILNIPYSQALPVRGGRPPYFVQIAGALPAELGLTNGVISGTPRAPGMYAFTIVLTDSNDPPATVTETFTLPVVILDQNTALSVQPDQVQLSTTTDQAPRPATVKVTSGGPPLTWRVSADAAWVVVEPASGAAPGTFTIGAVGKGLKPGDYASTVTVTMPGAPNSPAQVSVRVVVK